MKKIALILILGIYTSFLCSCASIMRDNSQSVTLNSNVDKVNIKIKNRKGITLIEGQTPLVTTLKTAEDGYFSPAKYTVEATKEGYNPVTTEIDWHVSKWYSIGNLGFGGLIGWLIVDPITGDMYYLDEDVNLNMTPITK